jgi:hypothetical protein
MQYLLNGCQSFFEILIRPDTSGARLQIEEEKVDIDFMPAGRLSSRSVPSLGCHFLSPDVDVLGHSLLSQKETRDPPKGRKYFSSIF